MITAGVMAVYLMTNSEIELSGKKYEGGQLKVIDGGTDDEDVEIFMRAWNLKAIPTILTVNWINKSGQEVTYGDYYWLYKYEKGQWVSCAKDEEVAFNDIAYSLDKEAVKNYYNYNYDISKTGVYRLKTYFFFDQDIPITPEDHRHVWIDFEIGEDIFSADLTFNTVYAFDQCLYNNPLSSYYPFEGTGFLYKMEEDSFVVIDEETGEIAEKVSPVEWKGRHFTEGEWNSMFQMKMNIPDIKDTGYYSRRMYEISDKHRLFSMDGELWLVQMAGDFIWSIYRLKA